MSVRVYVLAVFCDCVGLGISTLKPEEYEFFRSYCNNFSKDERALYLSLSVYVLVMHLVFISFIKMLNFRRFFYSFSQCSKSNVYSSDLIYVISGWKTICFYVSRCRKSVLFFQCISKYNHIHPYVIFVCICVQLFTYICRYV